MNCFLFNACPSFGKVRSPPLATQNLFRGLNVFICFFIKFHYEMKIQKKQELENEEKEKLQTEREGEKC